MVSVVRRISVRSVRLFLKRQYLESVRQIRGNYY